MRRLVLVSVAALSLVGGVIGASAVTSASTAPTVPSDASAVSPIVGTWTIIDNSDPETAPTIGAFSAGGNYVQVEEGEVGFGVWESTGPSSAALMITQQGGSDEGGGTFTIRATIEVAPDGQSFTADYTLEVSGVEGVPPGEYGPGQVTGTRIVVEPMGTPVGSIEDLFSSFEGTESTGPEAPPASEAAAPPASEAATPPASEMAPPASEAAPPVTEMAAPPTSA
jgi:hypothetical protein